MKKQTAFSALLMTLMGLSSANARLNIRKEDGLAITHPRIVTTIEQRASGIGLGLAYYLDPTGRSKPKITNLYLSQLPVFQVISHTLKDELDRFTQTSVKGNTVGVGLNYHNRLFDYQFLSDDRAGFFLTGIINRMDQAYKDPETCGETRLIYRLAYRVELPSDKGPKPVASRLPMTINLILNTKNKDNPLTCAEIAQRWKKFNIEGMTVSNAVDKIMGADGPLSPDLRDRSQIKRLEINLQMSRKAAAVSPDFGGRAVYLLKVFDWDAKNQTFIPTVLDNQVDRAKSAAFFKWLLAPGQLQNNLSKLDNGTLQIPKEFLDTRAYSIAPGGMARIENHVLARTISDDEIKAALDKVSTGSFKNIKSIEGFKRRISDMSCTGCHQSRAIGGFHFMGQDPRTWDSVSETFSAMYPGNAVVVPGSGHFFADIERRRKVVDAVASNLTPDYSTGFSSRPNGTGPGTDNWGAHCYVGSDASFKNWTCSEGTQCLELHDSDVARGMGVCISKNHDQVGDPTETGKIMIKGKYPFSDSYTRVKTFPLPDKTNYVNSPQSAQQGSKSGGFPGGSIRGNSCEPVIMSSHTEATCGALPAAKSGFNDCIFNPNLTFKDCIDEFSQGVAMRGCSRYKSCRDDYICAESLNPNEEDSGICVPPYFIFQFRVDGHPIKF